MAELPAWMTIELTDACTGQTFTLTDFQGKTVYVGPMATWCSNCRQQLTNVRAAKEQLNSDAFVFVALSVEVDLPRESLAAYSENEAFPWIFAVMSPEMLKAVVDHFGREASIPPSTPHFIIAPDGHTVTELITGIEAPEAIVERLTAINAGQSA
jgi:cytochrome oxidase Cu insertion factor (SCO1/SenC/PrrC family)